MIQVWTLLGQAQDYQEGVIWMEMVEAQSKKKSCEVFSKVQDEQEFQQTPVGILMRWVKTGWGYWEEKSLRKIRGLEQKL